MATEGTHKISMKEYTKSNHLKHQIIIYTWLSRLGSAGAAVFLVATLYVLTISYAASAISATLFFGCWSWKKDSNRNRDIYASGFEGEERLKNTLQRTLSDEYTAFFNIVAKRIGEIDCLVIGPSGFYIFEAKNYSGEIIHDESGWWRIKRGGRFTRAERINSPSGQVLSSLNRLKKYLRQNGIDIWIEGVVILTNPSALLTLDKEPKGVKAITIHETGTVFNSKGLSREKSLKGLYLPSAKFKIKEESDMMKTKS